MAVAPWNFNELLRMPVQSTPGNSPGQPGGPLPGVVLPFDRAAAELVQHVRQNPNLQQDAAAAARLPAQVMSDSGTLKYLRAQTAPNAVPTATATPTPVAKPPSPQAGSAAAQQQALAPDLGAIGGVLSECMIALKLIANSNQAIQQRLDLQLRIDWINMILSNANSPTRFAPPDVPTGATFVSLLATYLSFFTNDRAYPIGIRVAATWATPGGAINLSMNQSDNAIFAKLANGGPNGGVLSDVKILKPNETVFVANNDPNVPLAAGDKFLVQIIDPAEYLNRDVFQTMPYAP